MRWVHNRVLPCLLLLLTLITAPAGLQAQTPDKTVATEAVLRPFAAVPGPPAPPWVPLRLPRQTKPVTQFEVVDIDGRRALRVEADHSYGNVLHPLHMADSGAAPGTLSWQWKVQQLNEAADLQQRSGDDTTLKVCTLWDEPLDDVPFAERQLLRLAGARAGEPLPTATVCYVWDARLPVGRELDSPFTHRLRYIVLRQGAFSSWRSEKRDIGADFLRLFGGEVHQQLPPLIGVAVGADADNTQGHSLGYVSTLILTP